MALKGKKPVVNQNQRVKCMISGKSGVGKTSFALDFPKPYFIDTEGGAVREQYVKRLEASDGAYFGKEEGSQNFDAICEEVKQLATTPHDFKTLVIDSFSHVYIMEAAKAEEKLGNEFGRDKKEANRPSRRLMNWLNNIDMNVILICHQKDKWERTNGKGGKEQVVSAGTTFEGYDKLEYILDLWVEIEKTKNGARLFNIKKSRIEQLPQDEVFPLDYKKFEEVFGSKNINREAVKLELANDDQIATVTKLTEILNVPHETIVKWFEKVGVDSWSDMQSKTIESIINQLKSKFEEVKK